MNIRCVCVMRSRGPAPPAAGRPDAAGHGDLGERGRQLLPPAAGTLLQGGGPVRQRGLLLCGRGGGAAAAGAAGLLLRPQGEQVSAAGGRGLRGQRSPPWLGWPLTWIFCFCSSSPSSSSSSWLKWQRRWWRWLTLHS